MSLGTEDAGRNNLKPPTSMEVNLGDSLYNLNVNKENTRNYQQSLILSSEMSDYDMDDKEIKTMGFLDINKPRRGNQSSA